VSSILIAVVYHPPHASADDNYKVYNHIQGVVDSHLACHPDGLICIVGDFNPNSTNISSSRFRRDCLFGVGGWVVRRTSWVVGRASWVVGRASWVVGRASVIRKKILNRTIP
jgi:hypothetical protein